MVPIKRTTVILEDADQEDLAEVARIQRTSETEALRRAVRFTRQLMTWKDSGGEILLKKGKTVRSIEFL